MSSDPEQDRGRHGAASLARFSCTGAGCDSTWLTKFAGRRVPFVAHAGLFDALHEQMFGFRLEPNHEPYQFEPSEGSWKV